MVASALLACGCYGAPKQPPLPQADRIPTVIGRIVDREAGSNTYELAGGESVELVPRGTGPDAAALLSGTDIWLPDVGRPGGLLLVGEDAGGRFYAATQPLEDGCYVMRGEGYVEPERIHLSSGLVLAKAAAFELRSDRSQLEPSWILSFDHICLDPEGRVTSVWQLPLGA